MDGVIVINKEKNCTSHDVVYKIKKIFGEKVGHTGTLDPNATGVLPILIGKGTGLSKYLINHNKKYVATIKLGIKTDTADVEGNVIEEKSVNDEIFDFEYLQNVLNNFIGKQEQVPPMYSAIKVKGKKLYEYARSGKSVEIPKRSIDIFDLKLLDFDKENKTVTFEVFCSKGTYIRTLCEDISKSLGTVGFMQDLNRTMVGEFCINNAITISELNDNFENEEFIKKYFISIEEFFKENDEIILNEQKLKLFLNGVNLNCNLLDEVVRVYDLNKKFIGIASIKDGKLKRDIII